MEINKDNIFIYDIEANNLYPYQDKVWVISIKKYGEDKWLRLYPDSKNESSIRSKIYDFIFQKENPCIVAHNGLGYDQWVLWKQYGMDFRTGPDTIMGKKVTFFDTLYASQYLLPDRKDGHSLRSWGDRLGFEKIDYRQFCIDNEVIEKGAPKGEEFKTYHPKMDEYCDRDVEVTEKTFTVLITELFKHKSFNGFKLGQKNFCLMAAQGFTGVAFDLEKAMALVPKIEDMMEVERAFVEPLLPMRPLKKTEESYYKTPSKYYKQCGAMTSHYINFLTKHNAEQVDNLHFKAYGEVYKCEPNIILKTEKIMTINDSKELKQYFMDSGWVPTMWNFKKDSDGKPMRDDKRKLIFTSPKIQEQGKICPNLLELEDEIPKRIVKYLSLKNRLSTIKSTKNDTKGWVNNPRLKWDGRLTTGATGIASTHRQKHHTVVNVPKAQDGVLLGKEFRSLFKVDDGCKLIGVDQAALEARVQGHWTYKYDEGKTAMELIDGDVHSKNAKAFYEEETIDFDINAEDFNNSDIGFKPYRSKSKNGYYAIIYGCSPPKLASTLGKPEKHGKKLIDSFWKANKALKDLKDNVEKFWENKGDKKWIPGIDGRRLYSRSKHSLINLLFQSTGAIVVDYSLALFDMKMGGLLIDEMGRPYYEYKGYIVKRVIYSHDEYQVSANQEITEEIAKIMEWTMEEAGIRLNFSIPLKGEADIGLNWKDTH